MFVKLGVRYVIVVDDRGQYLGLIEKNRYLMYLRWLEKRAHSTGLAGLASMTGSRWRQEAQAEAEAQSEDGRGTNARRGRDETRA